MKIVVRSMTGTDLDSAGKIAQAAYNRSYSLEPSLRRLLSLQPDGWYLALLDDEPAGVGGAVNYGPFAYLGMMSVLPSAQKRGLGSALMESILGWLDRQSCPTVLLNARPRAVSLYARYGFNEIDQTLQFEHAAHISRPYQAPPGLTTLQEADLPTLAAFDAPAFGASRRAVLSRLFAENPQRFLVSVETNGQFSGFLQVGSTSLGAWHATRPENAEKLLLRALALLSASFLTISVPASNSTALLLCQQAGFKLALTLPHMLRGAPLQRDPEQRIYSLAAQALG